MVAMVAALTPNYANAFWFFSINANAAGGGLTPSSSTPILQASTNIDPNPDKGLGDDIPTSDNAVVAHTGPAGTTADVAVPMVTDRISIYVVRPGDTLSEIATLFGVSANTIIWANNLSGVHDVHVGDTLIILPISGVKHIIIRGDTLKSVAKKYSGDANEIAQFNGLDSGSTLIVGSTIIIPGGEFTSPTPKATAKTKVSKGKRGTIREPYLGGSGAAQDGYYGNPVPGGIITQVVHGWNAIDIGAARGTPIHASADGTVIIARVSGGWNGGYGNYVVITHDNGTQTLYSHMMSAIVSTGASVSAGQIIGYVGSTGLSTGPHLHFEVRGAANPFRICAANSVCAPH
ncbi:MAG: M23 family metallopeptidase [Minisyncoccia bacterium]